MAYCEINSCANREAIGDLLHIVGHKSKNKIIKVDFIRFGEIISKYSNKVLGAICIL